MKAIGFIGYSNSGKTTLIEKLIPLLKARGLSVSAIKNAHHGFDMDRPGKDSFRYREAGAGQVLIATALRWAMLTETPQQPATLEDLLARLAPCDLVIIEGFTRARFHASKCAAANRPSRRSFRTIPT
jgi:molybdopterin-guanine dinucleotide biosynthesis adapter protein